MKGANGACLVHIFRDRYDRACECETHVFASRDEAEGYLLCEGFSHQINGLWLGKGSQASINPFKPVC